MQFFGVAICEIRDPVLRQIGRQHHPPYPPDHPTGSVPCVDHRNCELHGRIIDGPEDQTARHIGHDHRHNRGDQPHDKAEDEEGHFFGIPLRIVLDPRDDVVFDQSFSEDFAFHEYPEKKQKNAEKQCFNKAHDAPVWAAGTQDKGHFLNGIGQHGQPF